MDPGQTLLLGGKPRAPEAFLHWEGGLDNNTHTVSSAVGCFDLVEWLVVQI